MFYSVIIYISESLLQTNHDYHIQVVPLNFAGVLMDPVEQGQPGGLGIFRWEPLGVTNDDTWRPCESCKQQHLHTFYNRVLFLLTQPFRLRVSLPFLHLFITLIYFHTHPLHIIQSGVLQYRIEEVLSSWGSSPSALRPSVSAVLFIQLLALPPNPLFLYFTASVAL